MNSDGCTLWPDGWFGEQTWYHCCLAHDAYYWDGTVNWQSHVELGQCVAQTSGGLLMGVTMMIGTGAWWLLTRHRRKQTKKDNRNG